MPRIATGWFILPAWQNLLLSGALLGRQGISSHLRIGIRKENEKFEAHAWVERHGAALNEPDEHHHHYAAFDAAFSALPPEE